MKDIVEAHGGTVGVESREGTGSTFHFTLRSGRPRRRGKATDMIDGIYLGVSIAAFGLCALFAHFLERM